MTSALIKFRQPLSNFFEGELDDAERLFLLSRKEDVNEFEIFVRAARVWNRGKTEADEAFVKYIYRDELPWWVKHYVRQFSI